MWIEDDMTMDQMGEDQRLLLSVHNFVPAQSTLRKTLGTKPWSPSSVPSV